MRRQDSVELVRCQSRLLIVHYTSTALLNSGKTLSIRRRPFAHRQSCTQRLVFGGDIYYACCLHFCLECSNVGSVHSAKKINKAAKPATALHAHSHTPCLSPASRLSPFWPPKLGRYCIVDAKASRACDKQHKQATGDGEIFAEKCVLQVLRCFREFPIAVCGRKGDHHKGKSEQRAVPRANAENQRKYNNPLDDMREDAHEFRSWIVERFKIRGAGPPVHTVIKNTRAISTRPIKSQTSTMPVATPSV